MPRNLGLRSCLIKESPKRTLTSFERPAHLKAVITVLRTLMLVRCLGTTHVSHLQRVVDFFNCVQIIGCSPAREVVSEESY